MFREWCEIQRTARGQHKTFYALTEKAGGRVAVLPQLAERVRNHYDDMTRIAEDVARLGFPAAASILKERLPRSKRTRSGELGEILATEFVEFGTGFRVPVRRLRYKDGREMALRGDDFIGVKQDERGALRLLKGESKSRHSLTPSVVRRARKTLRESYGRPTPISLLFVADRLLESGGTDEDLGRRIRDEVANRSVPSERITHGLFVLSGNSASPILEADLEEADEHHDHISMAMRIDDHRDFVAETYRQAGDLGNG